MLTRYAVSSIIAVAFSYTIWAPPFGLMSDHIEVDSINKCFLYGLILMMIGALGYVLRTGFLHPFLRGIAAAGSMVTPKSKGLRKEDERLRSDTSLQHWKQSVSRYLSTYTLGCGSGMLIGAIILQLQYI